MADCSSSQKEVKWTDDVSRKFIELFLTQLDKENWIEKTLTKEGKVIVGKSFKEATGYDLAWKIFKNHLHHLKIWYDCYRRLCKFTGISIDHSTGIINMDKEWWDARIQETEVAKRFRKKGLANQDLLERLFSGGHIGIEDGWAVGNGPDVYRPQYTNNIGWQFDTSTIDLDDDLYFSSATPTTTPTTQQNENIHSTQHTGGPPLNERSHSNQQNKRKRGATSNIDNESHQSKAYRERSDAIKLAAAAATEMSTALASDLTNAAHRMYEISEIEFGSSFYWDATNLFEEDEIARKWFIGIPENKLALLYLERKIGRKHNE